MRVLIVDDDYVIRTQLKTLLTGLGDFDCDCAANGKIGYDMFLTAHEEGLPYDLLTVDIAMPEEKGQKMVDNVRKWEEKEGISLDRRVKILMVTIKKDVKNVVESYNKLCDDYLAKPVETIALKEKLEAMGVLS